VLQKSPAKEPSKETCTECKIALVQVKRALFRLERARMVSSLLLPYSYAHACSLKPTRFSRQGVLTLTLTLTFLPSHAHPVLAARCPYSDSYSYLFTLSRPPGSRGRYPAGAFTLTLTSTLPLTLTLLLPSLSRGRYPAGAFRSAKEARNADAARMGGC
jgi:hypothetical protein